MTDNNGCWYNNGTYIFIIYLSMEQIVTITRQGQLTIPQKVRQHFGMKGSVKAILRIKGLTLVVEPKNDFWSVVGSLHSKIKLTDTQLKRARKQFSKRWAKHV